MCKFLLVIFDLNFVFFNQVWVSNLIFISSLTDNLFWLWRFVYHKTTFDLLLRSTFAILDLLSFNTWFANNSDIVFNVILFLTFLAKSDHLLYQNSKNPSIKSCIVLLRLTKWSVFPITHLFYFAYLTSK